MFILNGLSPFLVVSVDSKEFTRRTSAIAQSIDGSLVAGLGRSVLRPYVCSQKNNVGKDALRADMNLYGVKD